MTDEMKPPAEPAPKKRKRGRQSTFDDDVATETVRKRVEAMAGVGLVEQQIADALNIDIKTFRKFFLKAYKLGKSKAEYAVASVIFEKATKERDLDAAKFYLTHRSEQWREKKQVEVTAPEGLGVLVLPLQTED